MRLYTTILPTTGVPMHSVYGDHIGRSVFVEGQDTYHYGDGAQERAKAYRILLDSLVGINFDAHPEAIKAAERSVETSRARRGR